VCVIAGWRGGASGSFNPLHDGHRMLYEALERRLAADDQVGVQAAVAAGAVPPPPRVCAYSLSVSNADKPMLSEEEVRERGPTRLAHCLPPAHRASGRQHGGAYAHTGPSSRELSPRHAWLCATLTMLVGKDYGEGVRG